MLLPPFGDVAAGVEGEGGVVAVGGGGRGMLLLLSTPMLLIGRLAVLRRVLIARRESLLSAVRGLDRWWSSRFALFLFSCSFFFYSHRRSLSPFSHSVFLIRNRQKTEFKARR